MPSRDDRESESESESDEDDEEERDALAGKDLYAVLGLTQTPAPSAKDIKRAYHKMALRLHPDKNVGDADAAGKFQTLQRVYGILSDDAKRKVYDETGRVDDAEFGGEEFETLYRYYRSVYKKVETDDILDFEKTYRGGDEERKDVLEYYAKFEGDMSRVFAWVMCSEEADDSHRFADVVDAAIRAKDVPEYDVYTRWAKEVRKKKAPKDPLGARKVKRVKAAKDGENDLMALIQRNQAMRGDQAENMFAALEAKYAPKKKAKK